MLTGAPDTGCWSRRVWVAGLMLGSAPTSNGEEDGLAALVVVLRECVFGEGAGRACLLDT